MIIIDTTDHILLNDTRVLTPKEFEALRYSMLSEGQRQTLSEMKIEREEAKKAGDADAVASIIVRENKMLRYIRACDFLLYTGMRGVEAHGFEPEWYRAPRRIIVIPKGACKKKKCTYVQRSVMLSLPGCDAVDAFIKAGTGIPERQTFWRSLNRYATKPTKEFPAGIGIDGITPKMFRKTWASWLSACFPGMEMYISASMGHTREVLQKYYLGLGFNREEVAAMRERYLVEWGMRV